jgi:hypothetical protein
MGKGRDRVLEPIPYLCPFGRAQWFLYDDTVLRGEGIRILPPVGFFITGVERMTSQRTHPNSFERESGQSSAVRFLNNWNGLNVWNDWNKQ